MEPERYELFEEPRYHFDPDRREFLRVVGGGIMVCLVVGEARAQQPGRGRGRGGFGGNATQELGARLHIGETGQVTVYTGKVEVGQGSRTSLTQVVAEELRLPVSAIHLIMADTELTPNDGGTSGSGTTPRTDPQLRRDAAAARELLIDFADELAKVERGSLVVDGGRITHPESKRSFTFGELTKGKKLTKTITENVALTPAADWKVVGTPVPKVDGRALVTGKHAFASDVKLPGMLHGKVLRPATLNATLASANLKGAEALPGVTVIRDGEFIGVAASSEYLAEQALAAIQAEWKSAPQISDTDLFDFLKKNSGQGG